MGSHVLTDDPPLSSSSRSSCSPALDPEMSQSIDGLKGPESCCKLLRLFLSMIRGAPMEDKEVEAKVDAEAGKFIRKGEEWRLSPGDGFGLKSTSIFCASSAIELTQLSLFL